MRFRLAAAAGVVAIGCVAIPAVASGGTPCAIRDVAGWSLTTPAFADGARVIESYAVSATEPDHMVATNGVQIVVSFDGGCTWQVTYGVEGSPRPTVTRVHIPDFPGTRAVAFAALAGARPMVDGSSVPVSRLLRSTDAGRSWSVVASVGGTPLEIEGAVRDVVTAPSDGSYAYAIATPAAASAGAGVNASTGTAVWRSFDVGETWERASAHLPVTGVTTPVGTIGVTDPREIANGDERSDLVGLSRLAVRDDNPSELWVYGATGLAVSRDAGETFSPESTASASRPVADVAFAPVAGVLRGWIAHGVSTLLEAEAGPPIGTVRQYRRPRWFGLTGNLTSVAVGSDDEAVLVTNRGVFYHPVGHRSAYPVPGPGAPVHDVERIVAGTTRFTVVGRAGDSIVRRTLTPPPPPGGVVTDPPPTRPPFDPVELDGLRSMPAEEAILHPRRVARRLAEGDEHVQPYTLRLPRRRAVDVFFLIDVSGSMSEEITGLREGLADIVRTLTAADVDPRFGVGVYRGYTQPPAYERIADMGPPDAVDEALNDVAAGSSQTDETALAALGQVVTGSGQEDKCGEGLTSFDAYIEPGQQVSFRDEALRVVLHITDEAVVESACQPSFADVARLFGKAGIMHVGLGFEPVVVPWYATLPGSPPVTPRDGLRRLSRETSTFAVSDVDCDGDGVPEVLKGEPLVCLLPSDKPGLSRLMAAAISSSLLAVRDVGTVTLEALSPGGVVHEVTPARVPGVDLLAARELHFDVGFACPPEGAGTHAVTLVASARGRPVAVADARITCAAGVVVGPGARVVPRGAVVAPAPHGAGETVPFYNTQTQAQSNPQSQSQAQGQGANQGAAVEQRQSDVQVALADERASDQELAMSALPREPNGVVAWQWAVAAAICGVATQRASRRATVRVRTTR